MIYYITLMLLIFATYFYFRRYDNGKKIFVIITAILVVLFQGFRSFDVGIDLHVYIPAYSNIGKAPFFDLTYQNFEPGYVLLNKICYALGMSDRVFLFFTSCLIQIPIFYVFYKYSDDSLLSIFWYFAFGQFIFTFSGLRQAITMSLCFSSLILIKNRKPIKFILLVLLASTIHKSALTCLILYPVMYFKFEDYKFTSTMLLLLFMFIFKEDLFRLATILVGKGHYEIVNTGAYRMLLFYVLLYVLSFLVKSDDQEYEGFQNILFIVCCIYVFSSLHPYIARVAFPFELYLTLYVPRIFKNANEYFTEKHFNMIFLYSFLVLYFVSTLGYLDTLPFSFG